MSYKPTAFIKHVMTAPHSELVIGSRKCAANPQVINLGTAQSHLLNDFLLPLMRSRPEFTGWDFTYAGSYVKTNLKKAIAHLYEKHFGMKNVNPDHIIVGSGIAYLVEMLSLAFCEPGEKILIPEPCYGCFEPDMWSSGAKVQYIDLDNLPAEPPADARILLLTNPGNPIGEPVPNQDELLTWAMKNPLLHVITDEIYGLSFRDGTNFVSMMENKFVDPKRIHHLYGVSKDWGMAGLHVGFFYTRNDALFEALNEACTGYSLPSDTKQYLEKIFCNYELVDKMIEASRERLTKAEETAIRIIKEGGIPYKKSPASLFMLLDLTDIAKNAEEEKKLWLELIDRFSVHVLPAYNGFRYKYPGWFRLCFSLDEPQLVEGCNRLVNAVKTLRTERAK
ncbi:aminotransferase, classes I and II family protein [Trichomonas vaginalis G3]|uniref:Aminotransferase, classes I and II family protein n=1 Tax=Trichomonas vaginalis (strain ATCC PRA-98 / G3) TaxID=412133 RepID=A2EQG4_TRIV3|nr:1-aminocyclopropane-1-carboxylate synthase protein [Trichomonas vaginalis G3]EAY05106.1 aminotransferase, classes I and II family protein [Trichomonas vaginalis G3]KAI5551464.1 1-aminocyclopropane-1-carboxylate synthase protein [Trichomonas vaginalis G3]|eukprot:XP_001317329.1 aminotransferase, classes I and II family protein [Trichomonas vaginalis G3]